MLFGVFGPNEIYDAKFRANKIQNNWPRGASGVVDLFGSREEGDTWWCCALMQSTYHHTEPAIMSFGGISREKLKQIIGEASEHFVS